MSLTSCYARKSCTRTQPCATRPPSSLSSRAASVLTVRGLVAPASGSRSFPRNRLVLVRAATEEPAVDSTASEERLANWVPVFAPEELPKGVRKEVVVEGFNILLFWYRNEIFAIEARSPSEGAYSEGFMQSKFTQDYGIECPATGSVFSLKTGEVLEWYPNNPVLKALTPASTCRPMEVYPVKLTQDAVMVDIANGSQGGVAGVRTKGGSDTSLENNNVFGVEPAVYLEGTDPSQPITAGSTTKSDINPVTAIIALLAVAIISVAGTAWFAVTENFIGLGIFWAVGFGIV
eukprot:scaffold35803_cov53-Prasinocladus_malaysianus.AAC.1